MRVLDLVADLGEGFGQYRIGDDAALIELLTSANVACGFHAGDPRIMEATVRECRRRGVGVGAHPSYPDLVGFGRRSVEVSPDELRTDVLYQLGALSAFTTAAGVSLVHVSPHGRLANDLITDTASAEAFVDAVEAFGGSLVVLAQEGALTRVAVRRGLVVAYLGMADRAYLPDGSLVPRSQPGAVIDDEDEVAARAVRMAVDGVVRTVTGQDIPVRCDSLLLHGDGPHALGFARRLRADLQRAGVELTTLGAVLAARRAD